MTPSPLRPGERVLTALAAALLCAAVLPWAATALGGLAPRGLFHVVAAGQGFVACLLGVLALVAAPRVTGRAVPGRSAVGALVGGFAVGVVAFAWWRLALPNDLMLAASEGFALASVLTLAVTCLPALLRAGPEAKVAASWLPIGLVAGAVGGALLTGATFARLASVSIPWLIPAGRAALLQVAPLTVLYAAAPLLLGDPARAPAGAAKRRWPPPRS